MINIKTTFALATLGFAALAGGNNSAQAAQITLEPLQSIASQVAKADSKVEKVSYRHRRKWRRICARRWGRYGHRYRRCLRRHDVRVRFNQRKKWRRICARRWGRHGYRSRRNYRRCMARHVWR